MAPPLAFSIFDLRFSIDDIRMRRRQPWQTTTHVAAPNGNRKSQI
jgi:hypothetical protein